MFFSHSQPAAPHQPQQHFLPYSLHAIPSSLQQSLQTFSSAAVLGKQQQDIQPGQPKLPPQNKPSFVPPPQPQQPQAYTTNYARPPPQNVENDPLSLPSPTSRVMTSKPKTIFRATSRKSSRPPVPDFKPTYTTPEVAQPSPTAPTQLLIEIQSLSAKVSLLEVALNEKTKSIQTLEDQLFAFQTDMNTVKDNITVLQTVHAAPQVAPPTVEINTINTEEIEEKIKVLVKNKMSAMESKLVDLDVAVESHNLTLQGLKSKMDLLAESIKENVKMQIHDIKQTLSILLPSPASPSSDNE